MPRALGRLVLGVCALASSVALGEEGEARQSARLKYELGQRVVECPDARALMNAVSARLGYDPFRDDARRTVEVTVRRERRGLGAHVQLREGGKAGGSRDLVSERGDCGELASALTLAISIAIDPLALGAPAVTPPPTPGCPPPPACPPPAPASEAPPLQCPPPPLCPAAPPAPAPPAPARAPLGFRAGLSALASLGTTAAPVAFGLSARAGFRLAALSLDLEGRADLPSQKTFAGGRGVETSLLLASLVPCFHYRWLAGCAVVGAGALEGRGVGVSHPADRQNVFVVAGVRLGVEVPLHRLLALAISLDLLGQLAPVAFYVDGQPALYTTPPLSGALALGLLFGIP